MKKNINKEKDKYKTQKHHIIPKYYYNNKNLPINNDLDNVVNVLYKDHILLHYHLFLCSSNEYFKFSNLSAIKHLIGTKYHSKIEGKEILNSLPLLQNLYEFNKINFKKQVNLKGVNKGKIWINDGKISKRIYPKDFKLWKNKGFIKGLLRINNNIKWWINNGINQKRVQVEEIKKYEELGWTLGRLAVSEESKNKRKKRAAYCPTTKGLIAINDGKNNKFVKKENLNELLITGKWVKGLIIKPFERTYINDSFKQKLSKAHKDRIWVNNGEINHKILKKDLEIYLNQGFKCGRYEEDHSIFKSKTNFRWITKDGENKRVMDIDVDAYIKLGWKIGRDTSKIVEKRLKNNEYREKI